MGFFKYCLRKALTLFSNSSMMQRLIYRIVSNIRPVHISKQESVLKSLMTQGRCSEMIASVRTGVDDAVGVSESNSFVTVHIHT